MTVSARKDWKKSPNGKSIYIKSLKKCVSSGRKVELEGEMRRRSKEIGSQVVWEMER